MSPQPPETSKPTKDCRTCNRRRIKCDRGLPTCQKCNDRDLFCPGYGVPLRWIQGVASRGKQKGQGPEVARRGSTSTVATSIPPSDSTSTSLSLAKSSVAQSPQGIGYSSMILDKPQSPSREVSIDYDTGDIASFSTTPTIIPNPLPGSDFFRHPTIRRLMDHFIYVVAPRLAWVDSEDNPWRKIIAPLIQESQSLRCSLLALSAGDFAFKSQHDTKLFTDSLQLSENFRDKALKLLADQLKAETQGTEETAIVVGHQPQNTDLATTLLLLNLEILQPGNTQWRIHLWAARTMIRRWGDTEHLPIPTDAISNFLVQEFFLINVCAFMTTFTDNHVDYMKEDKLNHSGNSFFTDFHRVMHIVTDLERRRVAGNADSTIDEAFVSKRLDQARQSTLKLGRAMNFTPKSIEKEFEHVVDMYHHMGLLYIHRVLFGGSSPNEAMSTSRDQIFRDVLSLGDSKAFVQDLVWPLFIAGTECRGDTNRQNFVERKLRDVIKATGPLDRWQVLQFLKAFWAEQDCSISWIDFARAWAQEGKTFVVY